MQELRAAALQKDFLKTTHSLSIILSKRTMNSLCGGFIRPLGLQGAIICQEGQAKLWSK